MTPFTVTATMRVMNGTSTRTYRCNTRVQAERWRDELDDYQCVTHVTITEETTT